MENRIAQRKATYDQKCATKLLNLCIPEGRDATKEPKEGESKYRNRYKNQISMRIIKVKI